MQIYKKKLQKKGYIVRYYTQEYNPRLTHDNKFTTAFAYKLNNTNYEIIPLHAEFVDRSSQQIPFLEKVVEKLNNLLNGNIEKVVTVKDPEYFRYIAEHLPEESKKEYRALINLEKKNCRE